jgi:hypothetical protein
MNFNELNVEQEAKTGTYKWIADSIRQNPEHLHTSVEESFQKIFSGKYAFTHVRTLIFLVKM